MLSYADASARIPVLLIPALHPAGDEAAKFTFIKANSWGYLQSVICNVGRKKTEPDAEKAARLCRKQQALLRVVIRKATGQLRRTGPGENNLLQEGLSDCCIRKF